MQSANIKNLSPHEFNENYVILEPNNEIFWRKQLLGENYIFTIKYSIIVINGKKESVIQQILPTRLGFNSSYQMLKEYHITQHPLTREVTSIENRRMGMCEVKFKAILMDQGAGFQQNSTVQIWTNHNNKIFNIVHIHVNDCSEEVPIDV